MDEVSARYETSDVAEMRRHLKEDILALERQMLSDNFLQVAVLTAGGCFGEVALNHNLPRAATVRCERDSHFAVMSKADYHTCLLSVTKKKLQQGVEFLRGLPFLVGQTTRGHIVKLQFQLSRRECKRGQIIVLEGEPLMSFFIVISGEFQVTKKALMARRKAAARKAQRTQRGESHIQDEI